MRKWILPYQMWFSLFAAFIIGAALGVSHGSIVVWFASFWVAFPSLMMFSAIYNWIMRD